MRIVSIDGYSALCQARGVDRTVSLFMLQDALPVVGDYVMVSVGYANQVVSEEDAMKSWELYDQILAELDPGYRQEQVAGSSEL